MEVVNSIWLFFQDQILGMKWLNGLIGHGLSLLGLDINSRLGGWSAIIKVESQNSPNL